LNDTPFLERRKALASDAAVVHSWFPTHLDAVIWAGPKVPDPFTAEWLAKEFKTDPHWVWVDDDDTAQAVFKLIYHDGGRAHLTRFGVAPAMRGKGLARGMMEEIADEAYEAGADHLTLNVYASNPRARHIYEQLGFVVVSENDPANDIGPSTFMRLNLEDEG
jgi:ribosomal protein S18 acetylase RimI-like enzyme